MYIRQEEAAADLIWVLRSLTDLRARAWEGSGTRIHRKKEHSAKAKIASNRSWEANFYNSMHQSCTFSTAKAPMPAITTRLPRQLMPAAATWPWILVAQRFGQWVVTVVTVFGSLPDPQKTHKLSKSFCLAPPAKESEVPSATTPMKLSCPGTHKGRGSPTRSLMHSTTPRHCTIPALRTNSSAEKQELWPASLQKNPRSKADYFKNLRSWKFKKDQKGLYKMSSRQASSSKSTV